MTIAIDAATRLLFIGDSITAAGRSYDPEEIGSGYVRLIRDFLVARHPTAPPTVINRGIESDDIEALRARWERDVLAQVPDLVSIYVGVNDVVAGLLLDQRWRTPEGFEAGYRDIVECTRRALPDAAIVLCEPAALVLPDDPHASRHLAPYVDVVHRVAAAAGATCVVDLYQAFTRARIVRPDLAWLVDSVHPSPVGHGLIAETWLAATGLRRS